MGQSKLLARFVPDGAAVCMGTALAIAPDVRETPEPTAAELEIIRACDPQGFWTHQSGQCSTE